MDKKVKRQGKTKKADLRIDQFPYEYVIDLNGKKAAMRCGCPEAGAAVTATRWLKKAKVQSKIKELQEAAKERAIKSADDWDREIDAIAFFRGHKEIFNEKGELKDIKELTSEQLAVIHEIESGTVGSGTKVTKLKLYDKLKALEMKGKRLGIYKQTLVVEDPYMKYLAEIERSKVEKAG